MSVPVVSKELLKEKPPWSVHFYSFGKLLQCVTLVARSMGGVTKKENVILVIPSLLRFLCTVVSS